MSEVHFLLCEKGGKYGAECSECGEFFTDDKGRKGNNGMTKAIAHAKEKHASTGGMFGGARMDTLWQATIRGAGAKSGEDMLFREKDDWEAAALRAQKLVESSSACKMIGATITQVKRIAHLWN